MKFKFFLYLLVGALIGLVALMLQKPRETAPVQSPQNPSSEYICPTGWVNCMPGPRAIPKICNDEDYQTWAQENCPEFEGLAY